MIRELCSNDGHRTYKCDNIRVFKDWVALVERQRFNLLHVAQRTKMPLELLGLRAKFA
jgi:hypothetical protein